MEPDINAMVVNMEVLTNNLDISSDPLSLTGEEGAAYKGRYFTLSSGQDLGDKEGQWTREETRTNNVQLVTKTDAQQTIFCRKSSLSTFPPCLRWSYLHKSY